MYLLIPIVIVFIIMVLVAVKKTATPARRGRRWKRDAETIGKIGEMEVAYVLGTSVAGLQYLLNNVIIEYGEDRSSQIDHIFINKNGVWVIETKSYAGLITGHENDVKWKQYLAGGNSVNEVVNPIKQNKTHVYRVLQALKMKVPVKSLVVFTRADKLDVKADNVIEISALKRTVWAKSDRELSKEEMEKVYNKLLLIQRSVTTSDEKHVENVKKMQRDIDMGICPRCGGLLVVKNGRYGEFYGCKNYPKCRFIKKIDKN